MYNLELRIITFSVIMTVPQVLCYSEKVVLNNIEVSYNYPIVEIMKTGHSTTCTCYRHAMYICTCTTCTSTPIGVNIMSKYIIMSQFIIDQTSSYFKQYSTSIIICYKK